MLQKRRRNTLSAFLQSESKKSEIKDTKTDQYPCESCDKTYSTYKILHRPKKTH